MRTKPINLVSEEVGRGCWAPEVLSHGLHRSIPMKGDEQTHPDPLMFAARCWRSSTCLWWQVFSAVMCSAGRAASVPGRPAVRLNDHHDQSYLKVPHNPHLYRVNLIPASLCSSTWSPCFWWLKAWVMDSGDSEWKPHISPEGPAAAFISLFICICLYLSLLSSSALKCPAVTPCCAASIIDGGVFSVFSVGSLTEGLLHVPVRVMHCTTAAGRWNHSE